MASMLREGFAVLLYHPDTSVGLGSKGFARVITLREPMLKRDFSCGWQAALTILPLLML